MPLDEDKTMIGPIKSLIRTAPRCQPFQPLSAIRPTYPKTRDPATLSRTGGRPINGMLPGAGWNSALKQEKGAILGRMTPS